MQQGVDSKLDKLFLLELISLDHYIILCAALPMLSILLENIVEVEYSACVIIKIVCLFTKPKHSSLELVLFVW
jgi:hypothetical protein